MYGAQYLIEWHWIDNIYIFTSARQWYDIFCVLKQVIEMLPKSAFRFIHVRVYDVFM